MASTRLPLLALAALLSAGSGEDAWQHGAAASLAADDECDAASPQDGRGCALSALQLRGATVVPADLEKALARDDAGSSAGVALAQKAAVGRQAPQATCSRVTTGTCTMFPCNSWRGNTTCEQGSCICKEPACANAHGICVKPGPPECKADTGGTCRIYGCSAALGATTCSSGRCLCAPGLCASSFSGECARPEQCLKDTGGSCTYMSCNENRGPSECVAGKCVCPTGYCAQDNGAGYGVCVLQSHPDYLGFVAAVNQDHPTFPAPHDQVTTALAFSGGGARALSVAMGAYRALETLGLLAKVDAISSISGGTWASAIYMFANKSTFELVGPPSSVSHLTMAKLNEVPPAMGFTVTQSCHSFVKRLLENALPAEEIWQLFVGETILKPFGLDNRGAFMAATPADVDRIKHENPQLKDQPFLTPRQDRPKVFVMGGAVLAPLGYQAGPDSAVALQMSPDYTGSPFWPDGKPNALPKLMYSPATNGATRPLTNIAVGGGLVETFAFGGEAPKGGQTGGGRAHMDPPQAPFSLVSAVGISSVAPAAKLAAQGKYQFIIPQGNFWPVLPKGESQKALEYQLGDGGNFENSGLLAMLQRGAKKVAMWVSTYTPLSATVDFCKPQPGLDLDALFAKGEAVDSTLSCQFGYPYQDAGNFYTHNQVFEKKELLPLLCELQKLKAAGKPTVHRASYKVLPNTWWGIQGGYTVDLLIVYLEQCKDFEAALPPDTRAALGPPIAAQRTWKTSGEFARFPHYYTTQQTEEPSEVIRLTNREVNLLAAQSEYMVHANEKLFREVLCPDGLPGMCCRQPELPFCSAKGVFR